MQLDGTVAYQLMGKANYDATGYLATHPLSRHSKLKLVIHQYR